MTSKAGRTKVPSDTRPFKSKGEHLALHLQYYLKYGDPSWENLGRILVPSNRAEEWVEAFKEMIVLQLVRRLIAAGGIILSQYDLNVDAIVEREIKQMILDNMVTHWDNVNVIYERLLPAILSSKKDITDGTRNEIQASAKRENPYCYLCGVELDFVTREEYNSATIDHVWPRAYGGEPDFENLLVACLACNNLKADTPSWAMYHIQSLVVGHIDKIGELPKWTRLAIRTREARKTAVNEKISLREAFLNLELTDELVAANIGAIDGFNLNISS